MDTPFATLAVQPPTVRCIGVEMRPFSLGHLCVLMHLESPFVVGSLPLYDDLLRAAYVCSNDWKENSKLRFAKDQTGKSTIILSLADRLKVWLWGKLAGNFDIAQAIAVLSLHVRDSMYIPQARKQKNGRSLYSEWNTRLYAFLRCSGYSHAEAMDAPLLLANKLFVSYLETEGAVEFMSEREDRASEVLTKSIEEAERLFGSGQEIRSVVA